MRKGQTRIAVESTKVSDEAFSRHYPSGKLPLLTTAVLQAIAHNYEQGKIPSQQELSAVQSERQRAIEKIEWGNAAARPDVAARITSAIATINITLSLDELAHEGRSYRERQQWNARKQRTLELDEAILQELSKNPEATSVEIWNALSNYYDNDLQITVHGERMEWAFHGTPPSCGWITKASFPSKVSRLRKKLRK